MVCGFDILYHDVSILVIAVDHVHICREYYGVRRTQMVDVSLWLVDCPRSKIIDLRSSNSTGTSLSLIERKHTEYRRYGGDKQASLDPWVWDDIRSRKADSFA